MSVFYLKKTRLNFTSNFLHQNDPISKYLCKNELRSGLSGLKTLGSTSSY